MVKNIKIWKKKLIKWMASLQRAVNASVCMVPTPTHPPANHFWEQWLPLYKLFLVNQKRQRDHECVCYVVVFVFLIVFYAEIYVNNFFYFLKIIFNINTSKRFKKYKLHLILAKKNPKFDEMQVETHNQTASILKTAKWPKHPWITPTLW